MKNKSKSLKAKLAAVLSLVPLAGAANSQTFAAEPAAETVAGQESDQIYEKNGRLVDDDRISQADTDVEDNEQTLGLTEKKENQLEEKQGAENAPDSGKPEVTKPEDMGPTPLPMTNPQKWKSSRGEVLNAISASIEEDRKKLNDIQTQMNEPQNIELNASEQIISLRDSLSRSVSFYDDVDQEISNLSMKIYTGDKLDTAKVDGQINNLDRRVLSESSSVESIQSRWKRLSQMLLNMNMKKKIKEELAKINALKQMNGRIGIITTDCRTMMNDMKKLDPAIIGDMEVQLDDIRTNVEKIKAKILRADKMTSPAIVELSKQVSIYFDDLKSLKDTLNEMIVDAARMTNERVIKSESSRIDAIEKTIEMKLSVVLEERDMTKQQFERMTSIKNRINKIFNDIHSKLDMDLDSLGKKGEESSECAPATRARWHKAVNEAIKKINEQIRSWDSILEDIQKDDLLRITWDPVEGAKLLRDKMMEKTKAIRESKDLTVREKVLHIAKSMNAVQPGTGTAMLPLIRSFLDPNRALNVTDEFGNVVSDRLAPYSFQLTGVGGSGKTSGAKLLADAFGADVVLVASNDLKDQNAFNLKKNELVTKLGASSKKPVLVVFDEVDTGTCVVTDAAGNRLPGKSSGRSMDQNVAREAGTVIRDVNGNPIQPGTWKFKYQNAQVNQRMGSNANSRGTKVGSELSSHLQRDERGFVNFSEFIRLLDQGPNGKVLGIVSTSNYRLDQMPAEVSRRIAPTGNEVYVNKPTAKNLADIIKIRFPGLSFSDGFSIKEGAERIGKQAFNYGWTAPKLITNLNQLANAIKDSADTKCAIPCKGLCKLIAGSETFQNIVEEAKVKKQARALREKQKAIDEQQATSAVADLGSDSTGVSDDDLLNLGRDEELTEAEQELFAE